MEALWTVHMWSKGQAGVHLCPQVFQTLHLLHTQTIHGSAGLETSLGFL